MNKKISNNPDERVSYGLSALSKTLLPYAKSLLGKKGFVEIDILTNWPQIVGEELADYSFPQRIEFKRENKNDGILHLSVPTGAFALEIKHREKYILDKINTYFGYNAVSGIKIMQNQQLTPQKGHKQPPDSVAPEPLLSADDEKYIENLTAPIDNKELKAIISKLGKDILNKHKREKK